MKSLRRLAGVALVAMAALASGPVATAEAAPKAWVLDWQMTAGTVNYTLLGGLSQTPGNAHSGQIWFDTSDDEDSAVMYDWTCPRGVVPPLWYDAGQPPTTSCRILRALSLDWGTQRLTPKVGLGMRQASEWTVHPVYDDLAGHAVNRTVTSRYTLHGVGPTTTQDQASSTGYRDVTKTRAAVATGHFGRISFSDPRIQLSGVQLIGEWSYVRAG